MYSCLSHAITLTVSRAMPGGAGGRTPLSKLACFETYQWTTLNVLANTVRNAGDGEHTEDQSESEQKQ
jgi:hypothetical protein